MKLHILSDLHLEFGPFSPPQTDADVVILAGDIFTGSRGLDWARAVFPDKEIIYVAGNHEFYSFDWHALLDTLSEEARRLGIRFLENTAAEINGVRFLGCTLWTDFELFGPEKMPDTMRACQRQMSDFKLIKWRGKRLNPISVRTRHLASRAWLEETLSIPFEGPTVVVTHHLPSMRSVPSRYAADATTGSYASHLDGLFGKAALWIHGHTHNAADYLALGTRVLCNPRGYPGDAGSLEGARNGFQEDLVVEVDSMPPLPTETQMRAR